MLIIGCDETNYPLLFNKTNYMIINKHPAKSVDLDFNLTINAGVLLERVHSVKYLGVVIDDKSSWAERLKHLFLQLARYSGIFYRLQNVITQKTLIMFYSRHGQTTAREPNPARRSFCFCPPTLTQT